MFLNCLLQVSKSKNTSIVTDSQIPYITTALKVSVFGVLLVRIQS